MTPGSRSSPGPEPTGADGGHAEALAAHARRFEQAFGDGPRPVRLFYAPGRVNLMGAHLDYNGGPVMPMAVDRGTYVAVRARDDGRLRLRSTREKGQLLCPIDRPPARSGRWHDYPNGVLRSLWAEGARGPGLDALFGGDLPIGAGLSSSASICIAFALALDRLWGLAAGVERRVRAALQAEREFVGVHCGIMDPYAIGMARPDHLLWLDCKDRTHEHLPLDSRQVLLAVADTGVRRSLARSAFNERVQQAASAFEVLAGLAGGDTPMSCLRDVPRAHLESHAAELEPVLLRRARHVVDEVERTFRARECLRQGNLAGFGALMFEAHASMRELYEVSVPELDALVDAAAGEPAVFGARLTGAGFGGCAAILLRRGEERDALARIAARFAERFGRAPAIEVFGSDPGPREFPGPGVAAEDLGA
jgi:galactokinase